MHDGISDGLGDELSAWESYMHMEANRILRTPVHPDHEDLVEEGRIALWRARVSISDEAAASPAMRTAWLKTHVSWRMTSAAQTHHWLGQPATRDGSHKVEHHDALPLDGFEQLLAASDMLEAADWAYHEGEILDALNALSPQQRKYVYARFWLGYAETQMKELFGYSPASLWTSPKNGARTKMRRALAHLARA